MAEEDSKNKAPAKQQSKSKSPGPRNRNRNRNRSKSPTPDGQQANKGNAKSKSPRRKQQGKGKGKSKSPARPKKPEPSPPEKSPAPAPEATPKPAEKASPHPFLLVDGLLVPLSNDRFSTFHASMQTVLSAEVATIDTSKSFSDHSNGNSTNGLEKHLTPAFWCDPALSCIVAEAKTTEFIPPRGRQQTDAAENKSKGPKKSPAPRGKKKDRSRSPGPRGKQGKSKSPARPKKGKSPAPQQKAKSKAPPVKKTEEKTNGNKNGNFKKAASAVETKKLPLHVQFDPFMVGMVTQTMDMIVTGKSGSINMDGRVEVLSLQSMTPKKPDSSSTASIATPFILPPSYLEVEPLISQMVPDEIAEAINFELSKKGDDMALVEEKENYATPTKQDKIDPVPVEVEDLYQTPPKDFKGRVAFFEKLTKQKTERPKVDPTKKVKAEVSEKVRSAHDQVRTSLVGNNATKKANKSASVDLPKDMTPLAQKRERVDKFFDKGEENAPPVPASKPKQASNWAKVETKLPVTFEATDSQDDPAKQSEKQEEAPLKVDKVVSEMEKDLSDKSKKTNGATTQKNEGRSKSPQRNKGRSKSPKGKQGKSKSPARSKNANSKNANETKSAPAEEAKAAPVENAVKMATSKAAAPEEKTPTPEPAEPEEKTVPPKTAPSEEIQAPSAVDKENAAPALIEEKTPDTEAVKEKSSPPEAKAPMQAPPSPSPVVQPASESVKEEKAAAEEAHGELLSRDLATEVLEDSEDANASDKAASPTIDDFPSLAAETPDRPKQSAASEQSKKSYAKALSEGKKREKANSDVPGSRFLIPELSLAGINIAEIESGLKEGLAAKKVEGKSAVKAENGSKADNAEAGRVKMEEMAQRLAEGTPQKKQASDSGPVEETKEDAGADPGFTPIKRDLKKKKNAEEDEVEAEQPVEQILPQVVDSDDVVVTTKAFKKNNFNQFSALADLGDIPTEIVAEPESKKVRGLKTSLQGDAAKKKKAVRFGGATAKEAKARGLKIEADEFPLETENPPPKVALPLHLVNNLAHTKPFCYIIDGLFWAVALLLGAPLGAAGIVLLTIYKLIMFFPRLLGIGKIKPKNIPEKKLAVVITGCDSGFGKDLALSLLEEGFVVFCCCLRKESLKSYEGKENAMPILMDVTKDGDVDKAYKQIVDWLSAEDGRHLHALVNNAGIGTPGLVDWVTVGEFQKMVDVNFMGMVRCTKAFLPHLKAQATERTYTSARIVNMVSMAGLVSGGLFSAGYEASKHAAEVFTTNLRQEMKAFGLKVTVINPSFHKTAMTKDLSADLRKKWKSLPAAKRKEYGGEEYIKLATNASKVASEVVNWDSRHVVDGMQESVAAKSPPARLLVGGDAKYFLILVRMLPTWISSRLLSLKSMRLARVVKKTKID